MKKQSNPRVGIVKVNPELYTRIKMFCGDHKIRINWWTETKLLQAIQQDENLTLK